MDGLLGWGGIGLEGFLTGSDVSARRLKFPGQTLIYAEEPNRSVCKEAWNYYVSWNHKCECVLRLIWLAIVRGQRYTCEAVTELLIATFLDCRSFTH
jgi:hypothetical protein